MKKLALIMAIVFLCLAFCACGKTFSTKVFDENGIYEQYDELSAQDKEKFLFEAAEEGYVVGIDGEGRITLTKDGKTYALGTSKW
ncbi:MAG: hypothetical protein IKU25_08310 [Clostridia bacterium]|nr:hypothetical protein [Clostridia bacterium]